MATSHVQILVDFTKKLPGIFTCCYFSTTLYNILVTLRGSSVHCKKGIMPHLLYSFLFIYLFFKFYLFIYLFYFWLRWVFVTVRGLSLAVAVLGYSPVRCTGFSLRWLLLLRSTGSRCVGFSSCGTRAQ